jgi:hypothetical protein
MSRCPNTLHVKPISRVANIHPPVPVLAEASGSIVDFATAHRNSTMSAIHSLDARAPAQLAREPFKSFHNFFCFFCCVGFGLDEFNEYVKHQHVYAELANKFGKRTKHVEGSMLKTSLWWPPTYYIQRRKVPDQCSFGASACSAGWCVLPSKPTRCRTVTRGCGGRRAVRRGGSRQQR